MKAKKYWIIVSIIPCLAAIFSMKVLGLSFAEKTQLEKYGVSTLSGLEEIYAKTVLAINGEKQKDKFDVLTEVELQTQVELALRKVGIKVVEPPLEIDSDIPSLMVLVQVIKDPYSEYAYGLLSAISSLSNTDISEVNRESVYAFTVSTALYQKVKLLRNPEIATTAQTWPSGWFSYRGLILARKDTLAQSIKNQITFQMNEFCNDYLAANPRTKSN